MTVEYEEIVIGLRRVVEGCMLASIPGATLISKGTVLSSLPGDLGKNPFIEALSNLRTQSLYPVVGSREESGLIRLSVAGVHIELPHERIGDISKLAEEMILIEGMVASVYAEDMDVEAWCVTLDGRAGNAPKGATGAHAAIIGRAATIHGRCPQELGAKLALSAGVSLREHGIAGGLSKALGILGDTEIELRKMDTWARLDVKAAMREAMIAFSPKPMRQPAGPSISV